MSTGARTGVAQLPLHYGAAPKWLFERMTKLARQVTLVIVEEFGPQEVLAKLSDPLWFQAFGCVLGFDWHSSGVTTTVCGALKEGLRGLERDTGLFVAGGKGRTSRKTPGEIEFFGDRFGFQPSGLVYASRMAAKVDSSALQDGYQLYHHTFVFGGDGAWAVIQQGMNEATRWARRYHWLSSEVEDFVCEPHKAICSDERGVVLNMVAEESDQCRDLSTELAGQNPDRLVGELKRLQALEMPEHHDVRLSDIHPDKLARIFLKTYERQPEDFERLLGMEGVGAKTIRALALVSELVYGAKASVRDPARFSFAHGGKDGHPYPVDRRTYDRSIEALRAAVERAKLGQREKLEALRRLAAV
ncbi:MAG: hypothetical protein AMJ77_04165 [Dehalococcoidia bacterium SM23_28_2]|nr:MAG: hypothetical protein AMJ77_04165 [Dehalococcoidia bacterium SM23_28_2]